VFNATFNNISAISWRTVLLVEEIKLPGEHQRAAFPVDYWQMRGRRDHMVVGFTTTFAISADHH
jgi:hypothetical protein